MSEVQEPETDEVEPNVLLETQEIGEDEIEKLKGDTVGDTLYSSKWIINILLSISKVFEDGWNEKVEYDLCTLWDMTAEKDIVNFLVDNDFLKIAEFALNSSEEPRFTEIILGIIGNMTCEPSVLDILGEKEELLETILRLLSSEDAATLVQILRLLRSALWNIQINPESKWRVNLRNSTFLREVVPFILKSSTNEELLIATTSFLRSSAEIDLSSGKTLLDELFESSSFLPGMLESFEEVFPQDEAPYSPSTLKYLEDWLELFSIVRKGHQIHQEILQEDNLNRTVEILRRILASFIDPWNLYPLDETKASCVHRCAEMILDFRWKGFLRADSTVDIDATVLKIIVSINTAMKEEEEDSKETMGELLKYLVGYWIEVSKISSADEIIKILKINEESVTDHTINLLKSKIPAEKIISIINGLPNK
ncbi:protein saal1 [Bombus vosnesenskii]|uniref:Protein saal1 n=1 Tax=Bombus vosnesenskii TaxID=207650 RepID=A0A6J3K5F2_9HYME|nr:protein saal1 [Bombus vosnesenskii]XP_033347731.1 protein saal1 [Bombus vosnesenskii]XP_050487089.1 protein saal1 [Bombus huntii]XP_050487090.1 protein saal1 [Bombus huntii]XP_050487091.1 protein saal1 [Bombus huntii]XP_050487092.1 protein saal1 [Bombus huntii]